MPTKRVSEAAPVQVYLDRQSRDRLEQLAGKLEITKSDVLRRGLLALERETSDPALHPVVRFIGAIAAESSELPYDVAREHDRFLATVNEPKPSSRPGRRRRD